MKTCRFVPVILTLAVFAPTARAEYLFTYFTTTKDFVAFAPNGAMRSRDLKTWEDVTAKLQIPDEGAPLRMRHGTVIAVPAEVVVKLRAEPSNRSRERK